MGGCYVGRMLTCVILSLLLFPTRAPLLLLYSDLMPGYLFSIIILIIITRLIRDCDELNEEEKISLIKKDEGEMNTV
jgi:hypothetical protein